MKTRIITAIVGILVLIGVLFTFDTLVFNFVIAAITLIAIHEVFKALGFGRKEWPMYARVRALHPADHAVQLSGVAAAGHAGLLF